jgi:hypothetical protein
MSTTTAHAHASQSGLSLMPASNKTRNKNCPAHLKLTSNKRFSGSIFHGKGLMFAEWVKARGDAGEEPCIAELDKREPVAPTEEDRGDLESYATAREVREVLAQGWSRADAFTASVAPESDAFRVSRWQKQVRQ